MKVYAQTVTLQPSKFTSNLQLQVVDGWMVKELETKHIYHIHIYMNYICFYCAFSYFMSYSYICMCLEGVSLKVSSQNIYNNSISFVIIKKGGIVSLKALHLSFDDD